MNAKRIVVQIGKWLGVFRVARFWRRPGLRIVCYHGFALDDESEFRPKLFIRPESFEKRLRYIAKQRIPIVSLDEGLEMLREGRLPAGATAITIDDGFYSVYSAGAPLLHRFSVPATVYVTTYYCLKQTPIFRLAMQYMFWKTKQQQLDLSGLGTPFDGCIEWHNREACDAAMWELIRFGETQLNEDQRCGLAREVGNRLQVDYDSLVSRRAVSLMSVTELRELIDLGVDLQLHTHRHQLPEDEASIQREITENRSLLEPLVGKPLDHLCYPSGIWSTKMWPALQDLGIRSATTCEAGLNLAETPKLGLKRFLDSEAISQVEFEAEMCGFNDLVRAIRDRLIPRPLSALPGLDARLSHDVKV